MEQFTGKVWLLGDDIDTDIIIPTEYLALKTVKDMAPYGFSPLRPELAAKIQPGDIIVVDGGGYANRSFCGEIMMRFAQKKGLAGVVVDGCIRDSDGMQNLDMPVYAVGVTPQGPFKNGPGEINTPVSCAGQVVFPGDILVGDEDGITVVHKQDAAEVLAAAQKKKAGEDKTFELMDSDLAAYAKKHEASTEQRAEGKGIVFVDEVYTKAYDL